MKTSKLENFKRFVWDPQTRRCMGRTGDSWAKLIAFYIALYTCLAAIWTIYFYLFHLTISDKYPKWQLEESLIGTNPGVGVRPQSPRQRVESALISYKEGPDGDYQHWVEDLNEFIEPAKNESNGSNSGDTTTDAAATTTISSNENSSAFKQSCATNKESSDTESFCPFDRTSIPPECTAAQNYSFPLGKPCILIKLNRIYGWKPEPYDSQPAGYPKDTPFTAGNIQITCEGQHDPDKEHIGPLEYFPNGGIETKYYPFLNQPGYQSPYVMVHFKNPKLDTLIYVDCKAWAKNVEHDRYNRKGMTSFELFIEKSAPKAPQTAE